MAKSTKRSGLMTSSQGLDVLDKENNDSVPDSQAPWGGAEGGSRLHPTLSLLHRRRWNPMGALFGGDALHLPTARAAACVPVV